MDDMFMEVDSGFVNEGPVISATKESFQLEPLDQAALAQEREERAVGRPRMKRKFIIDER
jgi:hypothetical protein